MRTTQNGDQHATAASAIARQASAPRRTSDDKHECPERRQPQTRATRSRRSRCMPDCAMSRAAAGSSRPPDAIERRVEGVRRRSACSALFQRAAADIFAAPSADVQPLPKRRSSARSSRTTNSPVRAETIDEHGDERRDDDSHAVRPHATACTCSNMSIGSCMPDDASRSLHFGRMPVARNRPLTLPSRVDARALEHEDVLHRDDVRLPSR